MIAIGVWPNFMLSLYVLKLHGLLWFSRVIISICDFYFDHALSRIDTFDLEGVLLKKKPYAAWSSSRPYRYLIISITFSFVRQFLIWSFIVSSCDSVSSSRVVSMFVIQWNTCSANNYDLQAEQTSKDNHEASHIMVAWINVYMPLWVVNSFHELSNIDSYGFKGFIDFSRS